MDGLRSWAKRGARSGKLRVRKSNKGEVQVLVTPEALAALGEAATSSGLGNELGDTEVHQALAKARAAAARSAAAGGAAWCAGGGARAGAASGGREPAAPRDPGSGARPRRPARGGAGRGAA